MQLEDHGVTVAQAYTIAQAEALFEQHLESLRGILLDGSIHYELDTLPLLERMRSRFQGPIIATSSHEDFRDQMVAAGCDADVEKTGAVDLLLRLIREQDQAAGSDASS